MSQASERRRRPRRKTIRETEAVWVTVDNGRGASTDLRAKVVDFSETGVRIEMPGALAMNTLVVLGGDAGDAFPKGKVRARVVQCRALSGGGYSLGLTYEEGAGEPNKKTVEPATDRCEVSQVSAKLDLETFRAITDTERSKRRGILELLYTARRNQPGQPTVSGHELEELLGCPREHLDFSLWYLKENALISSSENGRYSITAKGADQAEAEEAARTSNERLLAAGD